MPKIMKRDIENTTVERTFSLKATSHDEESRRIKFTLISKDNAGFRWDWDRGTYIEELVVEGANYERLRTFFKDHIRSVDTAIGAWEDIGIENGELIGWVRFGTDEESEKVYQKYVEGILTDCSVTYQRLKVVIEERDGEPDLVKVTEYKILECSAVGVGFDDNATVRRSLENTGDDMTKELKRELEALRAKVDGLTSEEQTRKKELEQLEAEAQRTVEAKPTTDVKGEVDAGIAEERKRTANINELVAAGKLDVQRASEFISDGSTIEVVREAILADEVARAKTVVVGGVPGEEEMKRGIEDALVQRAGIVLATPHEASLQFRGASLLDVARAITQYNGHDRMELAQRAMSTSDFTLLLGNVANRVMAESFSEEEGTYNLWTQNVELPDFKTRNEVGLKNPNGRLSKVKENGEFKNIEFSESGESWNLESYGQKFTLSRQMIINDDMNFFTGIVAEFGQMSKRTANGLVYDLLQKVGDFANYKMADGKAIFDSAHSNLDSTGAALASDSLTAARTVMRRQKDGKTALNIAPKYLLVSPENEAIAKKILTSEADTSGNNSGIANPHRNSYELIVENELSANPWYLAAARNTIKTGTLQGTNGQPIVQINNQSLSGTEYECVFDFGVMASNHRGLYKNVGA